MGRRRSNQSLVRDFKQFHLENQHVYPLFKRFAFEAIRAGRKRFSGRTIIHRIRWYTQIETRDPSGLKINDHWSPFYARMFMAEFPHHIGIFSRRCAAADFEGFQVAVDGKALNIPALRFDVPQ